MAVKKNDFDPKTAPVAKYQTEFMEKNGIDGSKCKNFADAQKLIDKAPVSKQTLGKALSYRLHVGQDKLLKDMTEGEVRGLIKADNAKPISKGYIDALTKAGIEVTQNMTKGTARQLMYAHVRKTEKSPLTPFQKLDVARCKLEELSGKITNQGEYRTAKRRYNSMPLENEKMKDTLSQVLKPYTRKDGTEVSVADQLAQMTRGEAAMLYRRHEDQISALPISQRQREVLSKNFSEEDLDGMTRGAATKYIDELSHISKGRGKGGKEESEPSLYEAPEEVMEHVADEAELEGNEIPF